MSRRPSPRISSALAVLAMLALAACNGGEPVADTTPEATATTTVEATTAPGDGTGTEAADQPPASPSTSTATAPDPTAEATEPAGGGGEEAAIAETGVQAAQAWIGALGEGDMDTAYAVLGEASRQEVGGRSGFQQLSSALAEGWGAFASADPSFMATPLGVSGGEDVGVVTVLATVTQEGTTERRALSLPYRIAGGRAVVDPFAASEAPAVIDQPAAGATVACDIPLTASVPVGASTVAFGLDGQATLEPEIIPTDSEVDAATLELEDGLAAGEHVLTVAFVDADGQTGAATAIFTVEDGCA